MKAIIIIIVVMGLIGGIAYFIIDYANKEAENSNSYSVSEMVSGSATVQIKKSADKNLAIAKAIELYRLRIVEEMDFSNGPCLSNKIIDDWVADIAHNPRQAVDDLPENQCSAYLDGTVKHFVELDTGGNLIRAE